MIGTIFSIFFLYCGKQEGQLSQTDRMSASVVAPGTHIGVTIVCLTWDY